MALPSRFSKERVLAWRKFFVIISVCYVPVFALLYGAYIFGGVDVESLLLWWVGYYFGYIVLAIILKKRTALQIGWFKFTISSTLYYLISIDLIGRLFFICNDRLTCILGSCNYIGR